MSTPSILESRSPSRVRLFAGALAGLLVAAAIGSVATGPGSVALAAGSGSASRPMWPGWDIARGVVSRADGDGGYVLDGFGGVHPYTLSGATQPPVQVTAYWAGWDIARGVALRSDGQSGYVLDGFGGVHAFGVPGDVPAPVTVTAYWGGWDIARGVVLRSDGRSGYVLDGFGGLHPFGAAGDVPATPQVTAYWPGWNIATGVAMVPGSDSGYVLDGWGGTHPFNPSSSAPALPSPGYRAGVDQTRGIATDSAGVAYTVAAAGYVAAMGVHPSVSTIFSGPANARGVSFGTDSGANGAAVDAYGAVTPVQSHDNAVTQPSGSALPSTGTVLPRFSPIYMGGSLQFTQAQAVAIAQQFDVISAISGVFDSYVSAMHAANPTLRIVAYMNGEYDQSTAGNAYPLSWYAVNASGQRIRSNFGNWLMDPGNPGWGQTLGQLCAQRITKSHYDGCFLDSMGPAALQAGYDSGVPVNPATGAVWTATAWMAATSANAAAVHAANPSAVVMANGLTNGPYFFNQPGATQPLLASTGIGMSEIWLRTDTTSLSNYPNAAQWQQDVDMLVQAESHAQSVLTVTKLWVAATAAQQAAWHKFALASFLLGANGHSYFSFLQDRTNGAFTLDNPWDHVAVGSPLGSYTQSGGLFQRAFSHGVAAVNPGSTPLTINLGRAYTNLDGTQVTSETLAPNTGDVFVG